MALEFPKNADPILLHHFLRSILHNSTGPHRSQVGAQKNERIRRERRCVLRCRDLGYSLEISPYIHFNLRHIVKLMTKYIKLILRS